MLNLFVIKSELRVIFTSIHNMYIPIDGHGVASQRLTVDAVPARESQLFSFTCLIGIVAGQCTGLSSTTRHAMPRNVITPGSFCLSAICGKL